MAENATMELPVSADGYPIGPGDEVYTKVMPDAATVRWVRLHVSAVTSASAWCNGRVYDARNLFYDMPRTLPALKSELAYELSCPASKQDLIKAAQELLERAYEYGQSADCAACYRDGYEAGTNAALIWRNPGETGTDGPTIGG